MTLELPDTGRVDRPAELRWNGSASNYTDAEWAKACILDRGGDGTAKERYGLPVATPGNSWADNPDKGGVAAAASRIGQVHAPADAKKTAYKRLVRCYNKLKMQVPQSVQDGAREAASADTELRYGLATLEDLEIREPGTEGNGSNDLTLTGYAAVYNQETTLLDGQFARLREIIAPGAFDDVLKRQPDVHLLIGHNLDFAMARTGVKGRGGLDLSSDSHGLRVFARLNPNISYVRDLAENMRDGVIDQMSFAFTVPADGSTRETSELPDGREDTLRTIQRVGELYDVTVTPQGAYRQTSASIRSLAGLSRRAPHMDGAGTPGPVAPTVEGGHIEVDPATDPGGLIDMSAKRLLRSVEQARKRYPMR